jgi:hypothetical protein
MGVFREELQGGSSCSSGPPFCAHKPNPARVTPLALAAELCLLVTRPLEGVDIVHATAVPL